MSELIGYVTDIATKHGTSKAGKPYTLYNVTLTQKDGSSRRVGWGFDAPSFPKGVWIKTELVQDGKYENYKGAHVEVKPGPAPEVKEAAPSGGGGGGGNNTEVQKRIVYQNSRTAAITLVDILERSDSLPVSSAKGKAGEAKRFEQILEFVEKLTVQLYHDADTLRLLEKHADAGDVEVPPVAELPPEVPEQEDEDQDFNDDIPF